FLVADEIHVETRAADAPTVRWVGYADGRYSIEPADAPRAEIGTTVRLKPRAGAEHWLGQSTVTELATLYGSLLPVAARGGGAPVTIGEPPWRHGSLDELVRYCASIFGFIPLDVIPLSVPAAGLTGVAFVLPTPANPAARAGHRVYLKRMLLAEG